MIGLPLPQLLNELALGVHWAFAVLRFGVILDGYLALLLAKKASACLSRLCLFVLPVTDRAFGKPR